MQDTIYALATGSLACAVSIIRISGPRAEDVGRRYCGRPLVPREARYCEIHDPADHELIDAGLVLFFKGPASFTGEDCVEFQLHGSRAVVARMFQALGREAGVRMAQPGEFIRRAFDNGKLALTSVEGVADLIDAKTDLQRQQALLQASGGLAAKAQAWREALLEALALIAAEIDFADEGEAPTGVADEVRSIIGQLARECRSMLADATRGEICRNGYRVVLCGPPNAGKSSLLNALARRDVAIVTEHAGTTRDVIQIELDLGGVAVLLSDTAGLRDTSDAVEAIGVERSRREVEMADLVVWLAPASDPSPVVQVEANRSTSLLVASKSDIESAKPGWADLALSSKTGDGLAELTAAIQGRAMSAVSGETPLVTNARQKACLDEVTRQLDRLVTEDFPALEFAAEDLMRCARTFETLLGRVEADDVLGTIFSRFCMGK